MAASARTVKKSRVAKKATAKKSTSARTAKAPKVHQAAPLLEAHGHAIEALHKKLAAMQDAHNAKGKVQLKKAVEKVKKAHGTFVDDVLFCIPSG